MIIEPEILKAARETINMNQEEFAKILGVSRSTLYKWEEGKATPAKQAHKIILNYLNIQAGKNFRDSSLLAKIVTAATMLLYDKETCKNIARAEDQLWRDHEQQQKTENYSQNWRNSAEIENTHHLKDENELNGDYAEHWHQYVPSDYSDELNISEDNDSEDNHSEDEDSDEIDVSKIKSAEILLKKPSTIIETSERRSKEAELKITDHNFTNDKIMDFLGRLNREQLIFVKQLVDFKLK